MEEMHGMPLSALLRCIGESLFFCRGEAPFFPRRDAYQERHGARLAKVRRRCDEVLAGREPQLLQRLHRKHGPTQGKPTG